MRHFPLFLFLWDVLHRASVSTVLFPLPPLGLAPATPCRQIILITWMSLPPSLGQSPTSRGCFSQIPNWLWRFSLALAAHTSLGWWAQGSGQEPGRPSWPSGTGPWNPWRRERLELPWSLACFAVGSGFLLFPFWLLLFSWLGSNDHSPQDVESYWEYLGRGGGGELFYLKIKNFTPPTSLFSRH